MPRKGISAAARLAMTASSGRVVSSSRKGVWKVGVSKVSRSWSEEAGIDIYKSRRVGGTQERVGRGVRECAEDVISFLAPFGSPVSGVALFRQFRPPGDVGSPGRALRPARGNLGWMGL